MKSLSNPALIAHTKGLVSEESRVTAEIITCLQEIDRRKLHLEMGYPTLKAFCTSEFGYSEPSAYRRINAMWIVREMPELRSQVESGGLNLTTLTQVQGFFKHKKKAGQAYSTERKRDLIAQVMNQSTRECERTLAALAPEAAAQDKTRAISANQSEIKFVATEELMTDLESIRALWGNQGALTYAELFQKMAKRILKTPAALEKVSAPESSESRTIPRPIQNFVKKRDGGECTYVDPLSKRRCGTKFGLQFDHLVPWSHGGTHDPENLRLLCRAHNAFYASQIFGAEKSGRIQ